MIRERLEVLLIFMKKKVILFGGSGFIGSRLTKSLLNKNYKVLVICRNKDKAFQRLGSPKNFQTKSIDIFHEAAIKKLIKEHDIVVNLIGKLFELQKGEFKKYHHLFPDLLSKNVPRNKHLIHISALGVEKSAKTSLYSSTKLAGQKAVISNSKNYNILKPSIVFGEEDNFFNQFAKMAKISPCLPLIGDGKTKFAPIYVEDLVRSIVFLIEHNRKYKNKIFEAHGLKKLSFKQLLQFVLQTIHKNRFLLPLPFAFAKFLATLMNFCKIYRLTPDQVELLKYNNIGSKNYENIDILIGTLGNYQKIVPTYLLKKS